MVTDVPQIRATSSVDIPPVTADVINECRTV